MRDARPLTMSGGDFRSRRHVRTTTIHKKTRGRKHYYNFAVSLAVISKRVATQDARLRTCVQSSCSAAQMSYHVPVGHQDPICKSRDIC